MFSYNTNNAFYEWITLFLIVITWKFVYTFVKKNRSIK